MRDVRKKSRITENNQLKFKNSKMSYGNMR